MALSIIMTAEEATTVRGKTSETTALDPIELIDGTFVLNLAVIQNHAHDEWREFLSGLPTRDVSLEEYKWYSESGPSPAQAPAAIKGVRK